MRKFEGTINGKIYTKESDFVKALAEAGLNDTCDISVSYKYVSVPGAMDCVKCDNNVEDNKNVIESNKIVSERDYVKNITNKNDVVLDDNLINKLKFADNKSDIKNVVCNKIVGLDNKIEDNLLHINELKLDYKKLDEKIKLINSQIKTLDDANNNYYLQKEYYSNIKNLIDTPDNTTKVKEASGCSCGCNRSECECEECKCDNKNKELTLKDICGMTPEEFTKYLKNYKMYNLADLVDIFIKKS